MSYNEDIQEVERFLAVVESYEHYPREFVMHGYSWALEPSVFPATITAGTEVFTHLLSRNSFFQAKRLLEVGCGTGVISCMAALEGVPEVLALDVNRSAVSNTLQNADRRGVSAQVNARSSDLFQEVDESERFDTIFWNVPWGKPTEEYDGGGPLHKAVLDPGYLLQRRYITEGLERLTPHGSLLLGTTDIGDIELLHSICADIGGTLEQVDMMRRIEVPSPVAYYIFRASRAPASAR